MRELVQWQKIDPSNNLVFPWFTHPFLEELRRWDLFDKYVLEYGGGRSTAWWADKCAKVVTIESNLEWLSVIDLEIKSCGLADAWEWMYAPSDDGKEFGREEYVYAGDTFCTYDIVVVDGIHRYECMVHGIELLSQHGGILIVDNWRQDGFLCPACEELVKDYEGEVFPQPDHTDHHGNCWKTAYFQIPAKL